MPQECDLARTMPIAVCPLGGGITHVEMLVRTRDQRHEREVRHGGRVRRLASRHNGALVVQGLPTVIDTALPHRQPPGWFTSSVAHTNARLYLRPEAPVSQ
jgi:hypothetical protein